MTDEQREQILNQMKKLGIIKTWSYYDTEDGKPEGKIITIGDKQFDVVPLVPENKIDDYLRLKNASNLNTIRGWISFFGIMAVIGLILGVISLIVH